MFTNLAYELGHHFVIDGDYIIQNITICLMDMYHIIQMVSHDLHETNHK